MPRDGFLLKVQNENELLCHTKCALKVSGIFKRRAPSPIVGSVDRGSVFSGYPALSYWSNHLNALEDQWGAWQYLSEHSLTLCAFSRNLMFIVLLAVGSQNRAVGGLNEQKLKYAHSMEHIRTLAEVVKKVKPTVIIGKDFTPTRGVVNLMGAGGGWLWFRTLAVRVSDICKKNCNVCPAVLGDTLFGDDA